METVEDERKAFLAIPPGRCDRWAKSSVMEGTDQPSASVWDSRCRFIPGRPQRLSALLKVVHFMSIAAAQNPGMLSYTAKHLVRACAIGGDDEEYLTARFRLAIYASTKVFLANMKTPR